MGIKILCTVNIINKIVRNAHITFLLFLNCIKGF